MPRRRYWCSRISAIGKSYVGTRRHGCTSLAMCFGLADATNGNQDSTQEYTSPHFPCWSERNLVTVIRDAVLRGIFAVYPDWRENYCGGSISSDGGRTYQSAWNLPDMFPPENMPEIKHPNELMRLIRPGTVHVLASEIDGFVRVGFEFGCKWDEEHGL